ncbi:hypothetical protein [Bacillus coahuilensis]|nr:hypothetical protein [Bacillus coahuilensis]
MVGKPLHFDGSVHHSLETSEGLIEQDILELTEEARMNLSGNPFYLESND